MPGLKPTLGDYFFASLPLDFAEGKKARASS